MNHKHLQTNMVSIYDIGDYVILQIMGECINYNTMIHKHINSSYIYIYSINLHHLNLLNFLM